MLERAQGNLSVVLDNPTDANEFAKMLLKIAENCTTNVTVQQYVFTRIEEILGLGLDDDSDAYGIKHAHLFTTDGQKLADSAFTRAINFSDIYLQRSAANAFACLLTAREGNVASLLTWINSKLSSNSNGVWDMALPALCILARAQSTRTHLLSANIIQNVVTILNRIGVNGNPQHIYELCFILWSCSLGETDLNAYLSSGAIPLIIEYLAAAPSRKVTRVILATLRNLSSSENDKVISEMLTAGLMRMIENITSSNAIKQMSDTDVEADFRVLSDTLHKNYRELTSFDRYASEVKSGALRWGVVHSEKFWRDNAKFMERDNFALMISLIDYVSSPNTVSTHFYLFGPLFLY